jgi:hypothetical protein
LKDFIVVNRLTRKIVAEFGTREEAEAFRDGPDQRATEREERTEYQVDARRFHWTRKREPPNGLGNAGAHLTLFAESKAEDRVGLVPNLPTCGVTARLP